MVDLDGNLDHDIAKKAGVTIDFTIGSDQENDVPVVVPVVLAVVVVGVVVLRSSAVVKCLLCMRDVCVSSSE